MHFRTGFVMLLVSGSNPPHISAKKMPLSLFSEQLTIVWLASLCIFTAGSVVAFRNVLQFPGHKAILYQLMFVPSFVTLVLLLTLALCRYINLFISIESSSSWVIIFFLDSKLYSQKFSCRISNLHLWAAVTAKNTKI